MKQTLTMRTALLLVPLAALNLARALPEVPSFGILRVSSFQSLEIFGAISSNQWNWQIA